MHGLADRKDCAAVKVALYGGWVYQGMPLTVAIGEHIIQEWKCMYVIVAYLISLKVQQNPTKSEQGKWKNI